MKTSSSMETVESRSGSQPATFSEPGSPRGPLGGILNIEKFDLLLGLYIGCIAVSELMGAKTFPIITRGPFTLNASVAIFVVPLVYSINDTFTEVYGRQRAQSVVRSGLLVVAFLLI